MTPELIASSKEIKYLNHCSHFLFTKSAECDHVINEFIPTKCCRLFLLGPILLSDPSGADYTPRNQKSKAVLAMLAVAPRGSRSRVWLRDKLWSDREEDQGSASLRQALLDIRKALGPDLRDILIADKYTVTLDMSRMTVDVIEQMADAKAGRVQDTIDPERVLEHFMEGMDIRDPEFEDWLTLERQVWGLKFSNLMASLKSTDAETSLIDLVFRDCAQTLPNERKDMSSLQGGRTENAVCRVLLVAPKIFGNEVHCQQVAGSLSDQLVRSLIEIDDIHVVGDVGISAQLGSTVAKVASQNTRVAQLILGTKITELPRHFSIGLELLRVEDHSYVWCGECLIDKVAALRGDNTATHALISRTADQVAQFYATLDLNGAGRYSGGICAAVYNMFELSSSNLDQSEKVLYAIIREKPSAQAHAWLAFLQTFRVGQRFSRDVPARIEEAQYNASKAIELDTSNALVLSLVAHVHSYLFSEYDIAAGLFERAIKINPAQPMGWDLYAMLHAYVGQYQKASAMADWAKNLGEFSPLSYYFDTTKCIVSSLDGDYKASIASGQQALSQRPKFNSVLRYLIASNAHLGNTEKARELLHKLQAVEPDFTIATLIDTGYPTLDTEGGQHFIQGLAKAGVKPE